MERITLVAVFYNEAPRLEGYFKNIEGMFHEMVVVDCGSTDGTARICERHGATVIRSNLRYFENNIGKAIKAAKNEWLFILSADERLPPETKEEVLSAPGSGRADVYTLQRIDYLFSGFAKTGRVDGPSQRLFRKGCIEFQKEPHSTPKIKGRVAQLKNVFYHYSFESVSFYLDKVNQYLVHMPGEFKKAGNAKRVSIGERNLLVGLLFGAHGIRRLLLFPVFQVGNFLFRKRFILEGMNGLLYSLFSGIHVFLEEAIYMDEKRRKEKGAALDWRREYPDRK
ncbi:MAG: glycosyltransferase family 2 protein [Candidatus Micrarchaeia archaeon]